MFYDFLSDITKSQAKIWREPLVGAVSTRAKSFHNVRKGLHVGLDAALDMGLAMYQFFGGAPWSVRRDWIQILVMSKIPNFSGLNAIE